MPELRGGEKEWCRNWHVPGLTFHKDTGVPHMVALEGRAILKHFLALFTKKGESFCVANDEKCPKNIFVQHWKPMSGIVVGGGQGVSLSIMLQRRIHIKKSFSVCN
jgi:hypothetical protein